MTRLVSCASLLHACGPSQGEPPSDLGPISTTGTPTPRYRFSWEPDGLEPLELELYHSVDLGVTTGEGCSPSMMVSIRTSDLGVDRPGEANFSLFFNGPLSVGLVSPLPDLDLWRAEYGDTTGEPIAITSYDPWHRVEVLGGHARVISFDSNRWEFRLEGEGLAICERAQEDCADLEGATVVITSIDAAGTLPEPRSPECYAGEPFPWPGSWDGCSLFNGPIEFGECPDPMPW